MRKIKIISRLLVKVIRNEEYDISKYINNIIIKYTKLFEVRIIKSFHP